MDVSRDLSLTLRQLRDQGILDRQTVTAAREHVGAAGIEQTTTLERIIAVGRSQPSISHALERIAHTLEHHDTGTSASDTRELLEISRDQFQTVQQLKEIVVGALQTVTETPIDQISAAVLREIDLSAKQQLSDLEHLVAQVQQRTASRPQVEVLEEVGEEVHAALQAIEQQEAHGQMESLGQAGKDVAAQIAALDQVSPEEQIRALEDMAQAAQEQADALKAQVTEQTPDAPHSQN
ncbi:hypothetical protein [Deinococcus ruber]|uniref:Uncharacterized protein n=1 Tax=Deinococcus ruber TaxID=1848197 RepID=A0A918CHV4_9DEIO|nr:hypothetical protein [Deinococcus ruber]GGR25168.1 hypothetical protein GCM10008957_40970 [Deinococcus ruber]